MKDFHIDPHVHCRDWSESYKSTIKTVTEIAKSQDVAAIFDMPNTNPPIISQDLVEKRIATALQQGCLEGYYLWIGITSKPKQINEVAKIAEENPRVVGIKMYAGRSVGDLAITNEEEQRIVYRELAKEKYQGVIAVHCEKESFFKMDLWDPSKPCTWGLARSPESEIESVRDQIKFAKEFSFEGTLHITHVTTPESVALVNEAKKDMKITCAATPHHLLLSWNDMQNEGLQYKVNPPIRDVETAAALMNCLKNKKIDWIETDHAPHTREEKFFPPHLSGIESLKNYSQLISILKKEISKKQIGDLTCNNIRKTFQKIFRG